MTNKYELKINKDSNFKNCALNSIKSFEDQCQNNSGVGLVLLGHPSGAEYYGNELAVAKRMGFEILEYEDWISQINTGKANILNNKELLWVAENLGEVHGLGAMKCLKDLKCSDLKTPVFQDFKEVIEKNGYRSQQDTESRLSKRLHEPDYRVSGVCVLDSDYISANGLKVINNYALQNDIPLTLHINEFRCNQNGNLEDTNSVLKYFKANETANKVSVKSSLQYLKTSSDELVKHAIDLCEKNHGGVLISDSGRENILIELVLSCADVRYKRFGGSIVETSKGIRAYYNFLMFLMGRGVELLKELCDCIGINYQKLYQVAKDKNNSIKYEEYQKVISYCFFSDHTKDVSVLHDLIDCRHKGVMETTKAFLSCIKDKLSNKEMSELKYCLELIGHMDTEQRVTTFERMRFFQIEEGSIVKVASLKQALINKSKLSDLAVIILNSDPSNQCHHHAEEICSFSKCGYVIEYEQPEQKKEVA